MNGTNSAVDAISPAIEHVRRVLFRPFNIGRWFILGFLSFLQILGQGSGYNSGFNPGSWTNDNRGAELRHATRWISENVPIVVIIGFFVMLLVLILVVLFQWLSARGTFCYIDCIATDRAEVVRPWREHREQADSFFFWRLVFSLVVLFAVLLLVIPLLFSIWKLVTSGEEFNFWTAIFSTGLILTILPLLLVTFTALVIQTFLVDFVAPVMYLRKLRCSEALRIVMGLVRVHPLQFIVYLILRFVIALLCSFGVIIAGCLTCCIGFCIMIIPVVGQTLLQPIFVFTRSFPLFFLRGFGPEFDVFGGGVLAGDPGPAPYPSSSAASPASSSGPQAPAGFQWTPSGAGAVPAEPVESSGQRPQGEGSAEPDPPRTSNG